jgi:hypothetical protein
MLSGVSDLLLAAVAVVVVGVGLVAAGVAVTWIRIRRRLRALRSHTAVRTGVALLGVVRSGGALRWRDGWSGWLAASSNAPAVLRLQMWQAVDAATRAVETAERTGGAVGDLPSLCRRLRVASEELDRLLALAGRDGGLSGHADGLGRQVADVRDAASSIRRAALVSAGDAAAVRMGPLADDARREVECVTAGVARAGDALGGGRRAE